MIRILIADDHDIVRRGLVEICRVDPELEVAAEARDGREALRKVWEVDLDAAVLDISMPGRGGLDTLREICALRPRLPVLILTMHAEEQYAVRALRAGAAGYVTKATAPEELVAAIRKVCAGGRYVSPAVAERLAAHVAGGGTGMPDSLSDRELQVLRLIAAGKTVKEMAAELSLSAKTVSTYRSRLLGKLKMERNADLVGYALANGLVEGHAVAGYGEGW